MHTETGMYVCVCVQCNKNAKYAIFNFVKTYWIEEITEFACN